MLQFPCSCFQSLYSAIHICLTYASFSGQSKVCPAGCVSRSPCLWHPVWEQIHSYRSEISQLYEFVLSNMSLFVVSLVLCLPFWFSSQKLEVYYAMHFPHCAHGTKGQDREEKNKGSLSYPLGITVLPVREEGSLHSEF